MKVKHHIPAVAYMRKNLLRKVFKFHDSLNVIVRHKTKSIYRKGHLVEKETPLDKSASTNLACGNLHNFSFPV